MSVLGLGSSERSPEFWCEEVAGAFEGGVFGSRKVGGGFEDFREAKVGELGEAGGAEEDVFGFDVFMDDAFFVGVSEGGSDLAEDGEGLGEGEARFFFQPLPRRASSSDVFENEVGALLVEINGEKLNDVGVIECGDVTGFLQKSRTDAGLVDDVGIDAFNGDVSLEGLIVDEENLAHCAGAERALDEVATFERCGGGNIGGGGGSGKGSPSRIRRSGASSGTGASLPAR